MSGLYNLADVLSALEIMFFFFDKSELMNTIYLNVKDDDILGMYTWKIMSS